MEEETRCWPHPDRAERDSRISSSFLLSASKRPEYTSVAPGHFASAIRSRFLCVTASGLREVSEAIALNLGRRNGGEGTMRKLLMFAALAFACSAGLMAQDVVSAVEGTVRRVDAATKVVWSKQPTERSTPFIWPTIWRFMAAGTWPTEPGMPCMA
jgi:hypothetical protein